MAMRTRSALSWAGSDSEVAGRLAAKLNDCRHVTIPFCGGLSILPYLTASAVVANDLNNCAINFYRHASGAMGEESRLSLFDRCAATLSHPDELKEAAAIMADSTQVGTWRQAWAFWVQCWLCRKGSGGTRSQGKGLPSIRRTADGGNNASRLQAVIGDLVGWASHYKRCEFESVDFRVQLAKVADKVSCGIYVDAPWVGAGTMYAYGFSSSKRDDGVLHHRDLRDCLLRFDSAKVVVRYGDDPLIRSLYPESHWIVEVAESRDQCNAAKPELWLMRNV